jgi:sugar lactone lactonase YvrE
MAFDGSGNLYVLNDGNGTVTVYAPGSNVVLRTISQGLHNPYNLQFDSLGNLYVLNSNLDFQGKGNVTVYAPGGDSVIRTISKGILRPWVTLALDASNNVYVLDCGEDCMRTAGGTAKEYAAEASSLLRTITQGIHFPISVAFDSGGNVYVGSAWSNRDRTGNGHVTVYAPGGTTVIRTISQGIDYPLNLATGP